MPADVETFAPPARLVVVPAVENTPTVRTTEGLSARKSAGSVAVADVPMLSKFWV